MSRIVITKIVNMVKIYENIVKLCKIEIIKENPKIGGDLDNSSFVLETTN